MSLEYKEFIGLDSVPIGIIILDKTGKISLVNSYSEKIFGYSKKELLEKSINVLFPKDSDQSLLLTDLSNFQNDPNYNPVSFGRDFNGLRKDGTEVPIEIRLNLVENPKDGILVLSGIVDITERIKSEKELKEAKDKAEKANAAKDKFLSVLSHELRTPLTPVLLWVETNLDRIDRINLEQLQSDLRMVARNIELEARLIDDLLDLTRLSRGQLKLKFQTTDIHLVLQHAIQISQPEILSKNISCDVSLDALDHTLVVDPIRMQQVFWNILRNAFKFTPDQGSVAIRSYNIHSPPPPHKIVIEITDTGIGIEPDFLEKMFMPFEQSEVRSGGGLGIGLALSKTIVEMHEGTITVESEGINKGSVFIIELPLINNHRKEEIKI